MATIRLTPSTYYLSNSNYLTVSNANNMYTDTDSTTHATIQNTRSSTTSYYAYIRGFNFSAVPDDAIVSDITIKLKAYHSGGNTSTIYCYDGTTQVASAGSTTALTTSATVKTFTNTTVDWDTLKGYGSDFGIRINCRRNSRNTAAYFYIYGAEIEVTYTLPVYHNVTTTNNTSGTVSPTGTTSVLEGDNHTITISGVTAKPVVLDNNVDVSGGLIQVTSGTTELIPDSTSGESGFTVANESNGFNGSDNNTYASMELAGGSSTGVIFFDFASLGLPSSSTINSVSCSATFQYNRNNSSSGYTASCQMYTGSTAKGSSTSLVTAGGTDVAKTTFNLTIGSWTASELSNARLRITATNNASSTHRFLYFYGATLTVSYTVSGIVYTYTITNIVGDHVIVVNNGATPAVPPVITVGTPSRTIISDESGVNVCTCTFTSDLALQAWEARATLPNQTPARGVGLLVESGTSLGANVPATVEVIWTELGDDGLYTISVYGQSTEGVWSE